MKTVCWLLLVTVLAQSCSHLESRPDEGFATGRIISSELEYSSRSQEYPEQLQTLLRQTSNFSTSVENGTITATSQGPCQCGGGICGCCSRILYDRWKQKVCVNVTYDPDEFSFTANIMLNDGVLYTRTVSGKRRI